MKIPGDKTIGWPPRNTNVNGCGNCTHAHKADNGQLFCHRFPPVPVPMTIRVQPTPGNPDGLAHGIQSARPLVTAETCCGEHVGKIQ